MTFGHVLGTKCHPGSMFDYQRCNDLWPDQARYSGAGDENRTRMASLEGIRVPTGAGSDAPAGLTWLHREAPSLALA
jgi:hypothetical protein